MRKGKNICTYPQVKTSGECGRSCDDQYCKVHIKCYRKNMPLPILCDLCGLYTRGKKHGLCTKCVKISNLSDEVCMRILNTPHVSEEHFWRILDTYKKEANRQPLIVTQE